MDISRIPEMKSGYVVSRLSRYLGTRYQVGPSSAKRTLSPICPL